VLERTSLRCRRLIRLETEAAADGIVSLAVRGPMLAGLKTRNEKLAGRTDAAKSCYSHESYQRSKFDTSRGNVCTRIAIDLLGWDDVFARLPRASTGC
jgi:hypothetical protein